MNRMNAELKAAELNRKAATGEHYAATRIDGSAWAVYGTKNGSTFYEEK